jgi:hypothetical protein
VGQVIGADGIGRRLEFLVGVFGLEVVSLSVLLRLVHLLESDFLHLKGSLLHHHVILEVAE